MITNIYASFPSIVCSACQTRFDLRALETGGGLCRCGRDEFDIAIRIRTHYKTERDPMDQAAMLSAGFDGGILGLGLTGAAALGGGVTHQTDADERTYELPRVQGAVVLRLGREQPETVVKFLSSIRREAAKTNLQSGQGLCRNCGDVFTLGLAGFTTEGYCSKLCKAQFAKKHPTEANAAIPAKQAKATIIHCSHCSKSTKIRPGIENVCMWCGTPVGMESRR